MKRSLRDRRKDADMSSLMSEHRRTLKTIPKPIAKRGGVVKWRRQKFERAGYIRERYKLRVRVKCYMVTRESNLSQISMDLRGDGEMVVKRTTFELSDFSISRFLLL